MLERIEGLKKLAEYTDEFIESIHPKKSGAFVVGLSGELGSGKTSFVQCVARTLGVTEQITSPTFVIEKIYSLDGQKFEKLIHIDAYRLEGGGELLSIGWDDIICDTKNLIFVEWSERVEKVLPGGTFKLLFTYIDEKTRTIETDYGEKK